MHVSISAHMVGEELVKIREEFNMDKECAEDLIETLLVEWDYITIEKSPHERGREEEC